MTAALQGGSMPKVRSTDSQPKSVPLVTIGWLSTSDKIVALEPYCDPPHAAALALLRGATPKLVLPGESVRWQLMSDGACKPIDKAAAHIPISDLIADAAANVAEDVVLLIGDRGTLPEASLVQDVAEMLITRHEEMLDILGAKPPPSPGARLADVLIEITIDRGPRTIVSAPFAAERQCVLDGTCKQRVVYPVRNLAPAVAEWVPKMGVHVRMPGVPWRHPLAGWSAFDNDGTVRFRDSLTLRLGA